VGAQRLPEPHRRKELVAHVHSAQTGLTYCRPQHVHGYCQQGRRVRARKILSRIRVQSRHAVASGSNLGEFIAWDPVAKKKVWSIKEDLPFVSGAMSTAGGLVFLWQPVWRRKGSRRQERERIVAIQMGTGIIQSPMTYSSAASNTSPWWPAAARGHPRSLARSASGPGCQPGRRHTCGVQLGN